MSNATYSDALKELAPTKPVKRAIGDAAKLVGLTYTRTFDFWYGKARRIDAHEARQIEEALQKKREDDALNEIENLRTRLIMLESRIAAESANGRRERADMDRQSVRGRGDLDFAAAVRLTLR